MTFRRGATLPVDVTLGYAESCDLGPTAGNGFYKRWPDDLALLSDLGVADLRLTFDWARVQPKPGEISGAWIERYANILDAAEAIGISVWATMYDGGLPRWFVNEGGFDDAAAVARWWPRWVERIAEAFGERVHGWIPFSVIPVDLPDQAWVDTWDILRGDRPVIASLRYVDGFGFGTRHAERLDRVGVSLDELLDEEGELTDEVLDDSGERWSRALHEAADAVPGRPLVISRFTPHHVDPEAASRIVTRLVDVIDTAIADGLTIETCLVEPAIAGHDSPLALVNSDREPQPAADAFLIAPHDDDAD